MIVDSRRFSGYGMFNPNAIRALSSVGAGGSRFNLSAFTEGWGSIVGGSILDFYQTKRQADITEHYGYAPPQETYVGSVDRYIPFLMIGLVGIAAISMLKR